ncbi:exocyst complex component EXO70A1-like [Cucurbita pepo subsp. pepo]|uniref:exocyst complex component EXO70A1-like n=1 Tax=Cucurbita pepo subsp. pepo TaxID=3664 RepID=UPI000C9D58CE|nr:exocyst complex component EXO70A1-like [Cucurbita pepo subsp. pepo]
MEPYHEVSEMPEQIILRWDSAAPDELKDNMIFDSDREEIDRYLRAVDEIQRSMSSASILDDQNKVDSTMQIAMARLEDEFRHILSTHTIPIEVESLTDPSPSACSMSSCTSAVFEDVNDDEADSQEVHLDLSGSPSFGSSGRSSYRRTSSIREIDLIPSVAIIDLRSIAERMIAAGYLRECIQVYGSVRKSTFDSSFKRLGIEKLSIGDIQRLDWNELVTKIRRWIRAAKISVRTLFSSEKRLCQQIFYGIGTAIEDACFMETVKGPVTQLFNFAEAISISRRSPEKLFKILDLHDALTDLIPDIDVIFESKSAEYIRIQAAEILSRLGEAVRGTLSEFENAVLREPSLHPVLGGTVHPLTRYVMNYVSLISEYQVALEELIVSKPSTGSRNSADMDEFSEVEGKTPLALHLIWSIVILQLNLEGKSRQYKDPSLAHFFIMNNVHYIVEKIRGSPELRDMIGEVYLKRMTGKYRQAATNYERTTWVNVVYCLRNEGLNAGGSLSSAPSKSAIRERMKSFNAMFEEVHRTQSAWLIPDPLLKEELRISITEKLIPAYRSFLGLHGHHIESGRHPENYIKYSVEELENGILDFFEGCSVPHNLRRRSH